MPPDLPPVFEVIDLAVSFAARDDSAQQQRRFAVDGVSLTIYENQTLAIVGESGCGKSVTALSAMRLIPTPPGRIERGEIRLNGRNVLALSPQQMLQVRGREIAMIFQEPMTSLNPVFTIGEQIIEAVMLHQHVNRRQARQIAQQALAEVGIARPDERLKSYPHQFSGGMRQRVMIAMALACQPKVLLADEPTTALDVTVQAQILALLRRLQNERGMGVMLITHDLGIVAQHADVVCVMYGGRVVEYAAVEDLFKNPLHPYTRGLLQSRPSLRKRRHRLATVQEVVGDPAAFKAIEGANSTGIPWWPDHNAISSNRNDYRLLEIKPNHWVGCVLRESDHDSKALRRPDINSRRQPVESP